MPSEHSLPSPVHQPAESVMEARLPQLSRAASWPGDRHHRRLRSHSGRDPRYVLEQLRHTDLKFTLRLYAHVMRFSDEEREYLKDLAEGGSSQELAV